MSFATTTSTDSRTMTFLRSNLHHAPGRYLNKTTRLLSGQEVEDFVIDLMRQEGALRKDDE